MLNITLNILRVNIGEAALDNGFYYNLICLFQLLVEKSTLQMKLLLRLKVKLTGNEI